MSLQASVVIGVVLLLRLLFQKMNISKKYIMILWGIPFICLIFPWKISSPFGFWNSTPSEYAYENVITSEKITTDHVSQITRPDQIGHDADQIGENADHNANAGGTLNSSGVGNTNAGNNINSDNQAEGSTNSTVASVEESKITPQTLTKTAACLWGIGIAVLCVYSMVSYWKLKRQLCGNIRIREDVYFVDEIPVPMVVGLIRPCIYLPSGMETEHMEYVIAHEETHIRRNDIRVKLIVFVLAAVFLTKGEEFPVGNPNDVEETQDTSDTEGTLETEQGSGGTQETELSEYQKIFTLPENEITQAWLEYYFAENGNWSGWFGNYLEVDIQRMEFQRDYAGPSTRSDIVYYKAGENEDIQTIVKTMLDYMISPLMKEAGGRSYTITGYALEEQPIRAVREDAWILDYVAGYYEYEGVDLVSMEEALRYEMTKDGMVPFMSQGSESTLQYILLKEGNVYRLQRYSDMLNLYNRTEQRLAYTITGTTNTVPKAENVLDGTLEKNIDKFSVWMELFSCSHISDCLRDFQWQNIQNREKCILLCTMAKSY